IGPWRFGDKLGQGTSGAVFYAQHEITGQAAAIKIVPKYPQEYIADEINEASDPAKKSPTGNLLREVACLKILNEHPNIVSVKDLWQDAENVYMVMDFVEGGELLKYVQKHRQGLPEAEAIRMFRQIISALEFAHRLEIFHRDLKLENMLLDTAGNVRIVDFGLGGQCGGKSLTLTCGSPHYTAPEVVRGIPYDARTADIWSAGVVLYVLLDGFIPFHGMDENDLPGMFQNILDGRFRLPENVSDWVMDLFYQLFETDPDKRITIKNLWKHPAIARYAPR
ncbi:kinase-like protein, partial [Ascodesmis nigricans]